MDRGASNSRLLPIDYSDAHAHTLNTVVSSYDTRQVFEDAYLL